MQVLETNRRGCDKFHVGLQGMRGYRERDISDRGGPADGEFLDLCGSVKCCLSAEIFMMETGGN